MTTLKDKGICEDRIFTDKASGKNTNRLGLEKLLNRAEEADEVFCIKLDRLGGSNGEKRPVRP